MNTESFSKQKIARLAGQLKDHTIDPQDAARVIREFCVCDPNDMPRQYVEYLQDGFKEYLSGARLGLSLGLEHPRGRPRASQELKQAMAYQVLLERVSGSSYEDACNDVAGEFFREVTTVKNAWRKYSLYALDTVVAVRFVTQQLWTAEEALRVRKIYKKDPARLERLQLNMAFISTD